jgi:hypothetical protein
MWFLWFIPCAIANRIRGGWLGDYFKKIIPFWGTTTSRLFVSFVVSVPVIMTESWKKSLLFLILLFIGYTFRWHPWQYMKEQPRDFICMSLRGLLLTITPGLVHDYYIFMTSGALMGTSYWFGYKLPLSYTEPNGYKWIGSDWGELLFGGVLGFFISINIFFKSN